MSTTFVAVGICAAIAWIAAHIVCVRKKQWLEFQLLLWVDGLLIALVGVAAFDKRIFRNWMQEDAWAEWATFFAFAAAAVVYALRTRGAVTGLQTADQEPSDTPARSRALLRWWTFGALGLATFCAFVAGEEISWGQRLFAFQPPEIFLEKNFQQELNLHNLLTKKEIGGISLDSRFLVAAIAVLFGIATPMIARFAPVGRWAAGWALIRLSPPLLLTPAFLLVAAVEVEYPIKYAGEASELTLGVLFLLSALWIGREWSPMLSKRMLVLIPTLLVLSLVIGPVLDRTLYGGHGERAEKARSEVQALMSELPLRMREPLQRKRSIHKRLFTAVRVGYFSFAEESAFLGGRSSPADRVETLVDSGRRGYFLDPWNNPYWVKWHRRSRTLLVYSFGPNRRRDSRFKLGKPAVRVEGDDIAAFLQLTK